MDKRFQIILVITLIMLSVVLVVAVRNMKTEPSQTVEEVVTESVCDDKNASSSNNCFLSTTEVTDNQPEKNPFTDAGCTPYHQKYPKSLSCDKSSFASQFTCRASGEVVHPFGLAMMECRYPMYGTRDVDSENYFSCYGGLLITCHSFLVYEGGKFLEIKNTKELLKMFDQIKTPEQAKWLVLEVKNIRSSMSDNLDMAPEVAPAFEGGGFIVTGYISQKYGCFDTKTSYDVTRITYNVTSNGAITEKSRDLAYKYKGSGICID